jgi:hypothetical protein
MGILEREKLANKGMKEHYSLDNSFLRSCRNPSLLEEAGSSGSASLRLVSQLIWKGPESSLSERVVGRY